MNPYDGAVLVAVLPVSDLDRAEAFYGRLGFSVAASYEHYRILGAGGAHLHLVRNQEVEPGESRSGVYLYVGTPAAVDHLHAAWSAAGVHVLNRPTDQDYGLREFAAEDPDGNLWRVGGSLTEGSARAAEDAAPTEPGAEAGRAGASDEARTGAGPGPVGPTPVDGSLGTHGHAWLAIVSTERCAGCGIAASEGPASSLGGRVRDEAYSWSGVLIAADDDAVRRRQEPNQWSALEYAVHVRDALAVYTERILRTLVETDPELGSWDHEAAIDDGFANESDVGAVADDLNENAARLAEVLARIEGDAWARTATRNGHEQFTIDLLARFVLHEVAHHRTDAERVLGPS